MEATQATQDRASPLAAPVTVDLENKLMEVGDKRYNLDMKQHQQSRFFSITDSSEKGRRSRVVVPMLMCSQFMEKISQVLKFMDDYHPINVSGTRANGEPMKFAFTTTLFTPAKRRYYFDVIDADDQLSLRISYVFAERRDSVVLHYDCLPKTLEIIGGFAEKYPSISETDDYSAKIRRGEGRRSNVRRGRSFGRRFEREGRSPRRGNFQGQSRQPSEGQNNEPRKTQSLRVCADPAPVEFTNNAKKYQLEIVEGANVFMRITEMINDSRKSTLHVPIECLLQLQTILSEMGSRFTITKGGSSSSDPKP